MEQTITLHYCDWHDDGETEAALPPIRWKEGDQIFELDLCRECKAEHRTGARRIKKRKLAEVSANGNGQRTTRARRRRRDSQPSEIREWARGNGFTVSDNGPIPAEVKTAYKAELAKV